jgi:TIR domain
MPFKYSCFISYRRGQELLMKQFIEELKQALKSSLEPFFDEGVFIDEEQIRAGDFIDKTLRCALLESSCMILVFTPKYFSEQHNYCAREYKAMRRIEEIRRRISGHAEHGYIIPIVFRGSDKLPAELKECLYCDFSQYTLVHPGISNSPEYAPEIDKIAQKIYDISEALKSTDQDPCTNCEEFSLPSNSEIEEWLKGIKKIPSKFPGR